MVGERLVELTQSEEVDGVWVSQQLRLLEDPHQELHHNQLLFSDFIVGQLVAFAHA